jgi:outer membrane protein, heavy metal efflux system
METLGRLCLLKTPTIARRIGMSAVLGLSLTPQFVLAQAADTTAAAPLSEADVIDLARSRSPAVVVAGAMDELVEARSRTQRLLPNPALTWARETVHTGPTGGQGSQDILTASIPIDIARSFAIRSLAASERAWMRAEASLSRTDGILEAVLAYYEVVFAERRVEVLTQAVSNLDEAARVLARREAAGSASGYESTRLAIASELSRSHLAEAQGALTSAKARLGALLGMRPDSLRVVTGIELISPSDEAAFVRGRRESRQAVQQARESVRLASEAEDRADWAWVPTLELAGGMKRANNFGTNSGYGYVVGVSLSIPFFDHGQAQRVQAEAQRALASARAEALTRTIDADVQSALATFRAAREELSRFESQTSGHVKALLAAAQSGYREGERTIVELLDAQRAQTDVAERRVSLLGTAKRAEVRLRAAAKDLQ